MKIEINKREVEREIYNFLENQFTGDRDQLRYPFISNMAETILISAVPKKDDDGYYAIYDITLKRPLNTSEAHQIAEELAKARLDDQLNAPMAMYPGGKQLTIFETFDL